MYPLIAHLLPALLEVVVAVARALLLFSCSPLSVSETLIHITSIFLNSLLRPLDGTASHFSPVPLGSAEDTSATDTQINPGLQPQKHKIARTTPDVLLLTPGSTPPDSPGALPTPPPGYSSIHARNSKNIAEKLRAEAHLLQMSAHNLIAAAHAIETGQELPGQVSSPDTLKKKSVHEDEMDVVCPHCRGGMKDEAQDTTLTAAGAMTVPCETRWMSPFGEARDDSFDSDEDDAGMNIFDDNDDMPLRTFLPESENPSYEDNTWDEPKEFFVRAVEIYENQSPHKTMPILRVMILDCIRSMCLYDDLPTVFYTILGMTLFFFGNVIEQDPTEAAPGEGDDPTPYWLAALDVFEMDEKRAIRPSCRVCPVAPNDWRLETIWGRTLVCLVHRALAREKDESAPLAVRAPPETLDPAADPFVSIAATFCPPASPLASIHSCLPPRTGRSSLDNTSANEMMFIAKDRLSRGVFHMPHPLPNAQHGAPAVSLGAKELPDAAVAKSEVADEPPVPGLLPGETFSRAKELFTIASEVLDIAERFPSPAARAEYAAFADGLLSQIQLEADSDHAAAYGAWARPGAIVLAHGRANLAVGMAKAQDIEERFKQQDETVFDADEAIAAREALGVAIVYLEKAREALLASRTEEARDAIVAEDAEEDDAEMDEGPGGQAGRETTVEEVGTMLAEALLNVGNLTRDVKEREALYARAQRKGGHAIV